jgi:hypothetical protein
MPGVVSRLNHDGSVRQVDIEVLRFEVNSTHEAQLIRALDDHRRPHPKIASCESFGGRVAALSEALTELRREIAKARWLSLACRKACWQAGKLIGDAPEICYPARLC